MAYGLQKVAQHLVTFLTQTPVLVGVTARGAMSTPAFATQKCLNLNTLLGNPFLIRMPLVVQMMNSRRQSREELNRQCVLILPATIQGHTTNHLH